MNTFRKRTRHLAPAALSVVLSVVLSGALFLAPAVPVARAVADPVADEDAAVPGSLLVGVDPGADLSDALAGMDAQVRKIGDALRVVRVAPGRVAAATAALRTAPGVRSVEADRWRPWQVEPSDPLFTQQWSLSMARVPTAWDHTVGTRSVRVALIDSGVDATHPDLRANVVEQVDMSGGVPLQRGRAVDNDTCGIGHGTMVAGIVGALGNDGQAGVGVLWKVGIVDLAVSSRTTPGSCGGASDSAILAALHYAIYNRDGAVDVVNLSVGGRQAYCPEAYERAIAEARTRGVLVVAAAGNSGVGSAQVPASCPGIVSVGAVGRDGLRAPYSAANPWVDLVAPGGSDAADGQGLILTTRRGGGWSTTQGTSFAAPFVTGVAALLRSARPALTPDELESILERSADHPGGGPRSDDLGWGVVRADRAVQYAGRRELVPDPVRDPWFPVLRLNPRPGGPGPYRVDGSVEGRTESVQQASATARVVFREGGAVHAVIARDDGFPDALAGSALGMGVGPLLFQAPGAFLEPQNRKELRRALPEGATVYVLGGIAGVRAGVESELRAMGYEPLRLAGATREDTAARVAREIARIRKRSGMGPVPEVIVATRDEWADAVGAGQLASRFAIPVLLTGSRELHPAAEAALADLHPARVIVIGAGSRISDRIALAAQRAARARTLVRLAGTNRHETLAEIAQEVLRRLDGPPAVVTLLNIEGPEHFAHALGASVVTGAYGGFFVSAADVMGERLSAPSVRLLEQVLETSPRGADLLGVVVGGEDVLAASAARQLSDLLRHR
jgi:subtilisin family serine protease